MVLGLSIFRKGFMKKVYSKENVGFSSKYLIFIMLPLMARYGDVAPRLEEILKVGWVFIIQEIGNLGTILLGLPIAILLGLEKEAIGATLDLGGKGNSLTYPRNIRLTPTKAAGAVPLYYRYPVRHAVFQHSCADHACCRLLDRSVGHVLRRRLRQYDDRFSSALVAHSPEMTETINGYAAASQLLTSFLGTYTMVFRAVPLQRFMYKLMVRGDKK